jgi:hypothetical protein
MPLSVTPKVWQFQPLCMLTANKLIKKTFTRNSSGGMFGAYKSSCAVLNRTSKVLGSDIAQWIVSEQKNAQDK